MVSKADYLKSTHQTSINKLSNVEAKTIAEQAYRTMKETKYHPKNPTRIQQIISHANFLAQQRQIKKRINTVKIVATKRKIIRSTRRK